MGNHLQNSLTNLIELFTSHSNRQGVIKGDLDPTQMAEHVVDLVDPKIRVINRYVQKLIPPVTHAWDYLSDVAVDIPGGVVFSKSAFINDPRTRLIVGSQEEMSSLLNSANQLLEHKPVQTCDSQTDMYFLLCMEIKEHNFFGAELSGEIIKREVQQTSVKFINRKILSAGLSEENAKLGFKNCAIEGLLHKVHSDILQQNHVYKSLIERKASLRHKLHSHGQTNISGSIFSHSDAASINPEMRKIEKQLADVRLKSASPDQHLASTIEVLNHPDQYLKVSRKKIALNKLGIKQEGKIQEGSIIVNYAEIEVEQSLKRIAIIVNAPVNDTSIQPTH